MSHKSEEQEIREMNQVLFFLFLCPHHDCSFFFIFFFLPSSFLAVNQQICRPLTLSLLARRAVCVTSSYNGTFPSLSRSLCFFFLVLLPHCLSLSDFSSSPLPLTPSYPSIPTSPSSSSSIPCSSTLHASLSKIRRVKPFEGFPLS